MDEESHGKHAQMAETIADCEVLLCGGMGNGAYQSMQRLNIRPIITDLSDVDAAVAAFLRTQTRAQLDAAVAAPMDLAGAAPVQVDRVIARVQVLADRYPEAAAYLPGEVL